MAVRDTGWSDDGGNDRRLYEKEITELYDEFADQAYRCARRGLRHEDAEEIVNSAFLAAWRHWERVRTFEFPIAYVMKTVTNLKADALATAARRQTLSLDDPSTAEPGPPGPIEDEEVLALHEALRQLSPREEQVTVLHYWTGLPLKEIADVLGKTAGHVRRTLSDARTRLRQILGMNDDNKPEGADDE